MKPHDLNDLDLFGDLCRPVSRVQREASRRLARLAVRTSLLLLPLALVPATANANVVGSDAQNFNTTTSGLDFVTVQSSETLKPGILNFGLFLNYAVNTLPYQEENANQTRVNFNDSLLGADFNLGLGLMENWDVGVSFPQIISQDVESDSGAHGEFAENGLTEVRLNSKYRFVGDDNGGIALVGSVNFNQMADNPFTGEGAGPTFNLEAVADQTFGDVSAGINVGYRWRSPGTPIPGGIGIQPFEDQIIASVAANYLLRDYDTKIIGEIYGSLPAQQTDYNTDRKQSSLEALLGLKYDFNPNLAGHVGGTTELMHGNASPDWRVYVGLNYTIGPLFSKEPDVRRDPPLPPIEEPTPATPKTPDDPFAGMPTAPVETFVVRDILFKFDSDQLEDSSKETLDKLAQYLLKPPVFQRLDIAGHTDSIGSAVYNLSLSQRRAQSVKRYLVDHNNIASARIFPRGYGESAPIADNGNYQGRALNRRVEFKITRDFNAEASTSPPLENVKPDPNDPGFTKRPAKKTGPKKSAPKQNQKKKE